MLKIITLAALATINCISYAHPEHGNFPPEHPSDHPEHPSDHPEHPSDHPEHPSEAESAEGDNAAVLKQVEALLAEIHKAYKEAAGITETLTITFPNPMGESESSTVQLVIGENSGSIVVQDQATFVYANDKVYATLNGVDNCYVEADATKGFYDGLAAITEGGGGVPAWSLALRSSEDLDVWADALNMFGLPDITIVSLETKEIDGNSFQVIGAVSPAGRLEITVNDAKQITGLVAFMSQPGMPEIQIPIVAATSFDAVTTASTFDAGERKKYDSLEAMFMANMPEMPGGGGPEQQESKMNGKQAPEFTLERMDGSGKVTLSDLKGQVVVLDFWATWCGPCKRGLPGLNKFDAWVQEEGLKVQVFAVNVWEEGQDEKVKKFWADNKYTTKVLMGSADEKLTENYKIGGIPTTAIIGIDGSIVEIHIGYAPGMDEKLKASVMKALGGAEEPAKPDHPEHPESPSDHPDHPSDHPDHPN